MSLENMREMEYNTARDMMRIPEYGRNIQKMIEFAKTIEDRAERNKAAQSIIQVMGQVNPSLKNIEDLTHKLWDHLFIISGFDFDVDSPYPKPNKEDFETKPERIPYPSQEIRLKHYGRVLEQMISKVGAGASEEERINMGIGIANVMKRAYLNWNRDSVDNRVIIKDLFKMSDGRINLPEDTQLIHSRDLIDPNINASPAQNRRKGGRNNNNSGKRKKSNNGRRHQRN
ncbi:DUF4290 domain-containing protein [Bacteroidota bacterium]